MHDTTPTARSIPGFLAVAAVLLAAGFAGCSGSSRPTSARASGKVICQGQPLAAGEVHFVRPDTGDAGSAPLDPAGNYALHAGIPPGSYRVFVLPPASSAHPSVTATASPITPEVSSIPERYRSEVSSGLTAEVKAGSNTFDFQLQ
jgi:hypothetical protein